MQKIIIDTDPGVDDAMAILFALASPELDLLGLSIVFGNGQTNQLAQNAIHILDVAGRPDLPVAVGSATPLARAYRGKGSSVHGEDGLGNIFLSAPSRSPLAISAAQFIVQTVMSQPGEVTLIAIGPLTNVALALRIEPRLVSAVKEVIIMGGAAFCRGNASPVAEANIFNDPEAARIVFGAGWPLTMVGLDVTTQTVMSPAYLDQLYALGNARTDFISRIVPFYLGFHRQSNELDGIFTHDPSAIGYAIDPRLFKTRRLPVFIETEGHCAGQTVADVRHQWLSEPEINICTEVDSPRLLELFRTVSLKVGMLVAFNIILDDIVFPEGRTALGVLGGGGPQAAFGMRLFADQVGLVAGVGPDLPQTAWDWLTESGIDTAGVHVSGDNQTPRAWQITEADGRRTQVWRVRPTGPATVPDSYHHAQGYHLGVHPKLPPVAMTANLRQQGLLSLETFRPATQPPPPESLFALLSAADIFSANLAEAQSLVGGGSPRGVARRLVEAAESKAQLIVLRLGAEGAWVVEGQTGQAVHVPAWPSSVMDAVGAGNAYCGGFLAGWVDSHDIARAGACGAVAASFVVEQVGLPMVTDRIRAQAQQRIASLLAEVDYTSL